MIEILARINAIYIAAKTYHWQVQGSTFYSDHLLFDRVADTFSREFIDKFAETYYMCENRALLDQINLFNQLVLKHQGRRFTTEELQATNIVEIMYRQLNVMIQQLIPLLNSEAFSQAVKAIADELATNCVQISGLLSAASARSKVQARLKRNLKL